MAQPTEKKGKRELDPATGRKPRNRHLAALEAAAAQAEQAPQAETGPIAEAIAGRLSKSSLSASRARAQERQAAREAKRRPAKYLRAQAVSVVCQAMRNGQSVASVWRDPEHGPRLPTVVTFRAWLAKHQDSRAEYDAALADRARLFVEQSSEIAEAEPRMVPNKAGGEVVDSGYVAWQRFRFDAHRWIASKLVPGVYGDTVRTELSGPGGAPLQVEHSGAVALPSLDAFAARLATIAARHGQPAIEGQAVRVPGVVQAVKGD